MENPLNMSKYLENTNDITLSASAPNIAPGIWLLNVTLWLGINLYKNKNITNVTKINPSSVAICESILKFSNAPKCCCINDFKLFPKTNKTIPNIIKTINITVSINAIIRKYNIDFSLSSSVLYTECNPFVKANNPLPADHNVNIRDIDIVPIDFEYTSLTIPNTNSFILDGIIFEIASNSVCC